MMMAINQTLDRQEQFLLQLQHNIEDVMNRDFIAIL